MRTTTKSRRSLPSVALLPPLAATMVFLYAPAPAGALYLRERPNRQQLPRVPSASRALELSTGSSIDVPYTPSKTFGHAIEGAAYRDGYVYAVHYRGTADATPEGNQVGRNVIGRVKMDLDALASEGGGEGSFPAEPYFVGPPESVLNGIEFTADGNTMLLADVAGKRVLAVDISSGLLPAENNHTYSVYCESPDFEIGVPNDLVLDPTGRFLYLSGQEWGGGGGLWMCDTAGIATNLNAIDDSLDGGTDGNALGRTNGIAISPDGATLYVTEAVGSPVSSGGVQVIIKYGLSTTDGAIISSKEVFAAFTGDEAAIDTDGMQTDDEGIIYASRNGGKSVAVFSPTGQVLDPIITQSPNPTNLAVYNGTVYITARCEGGAWDRGDGCWEVAILGMEGDAPAAIDTNTTEATEGPTTPTNATSSTITVGPTPSPTNTTDAEPTTPPATSPTDNATAAAAYYDCESNNPCTAENLANNKVYFPYVPNPDQYIQCGAGDACFVRDCALGTEWDQSSTLCVSKGIDYYLELLCQSLNLTVLCP